AAPEAFGVRLVDLPRPFDLFRWRRAHRKLHAFPTRRSSDLRQLDPVRALRIGLVDEVVPQPILLPVALQRAREFAGGRPLPARRDRKSTRLNSSHVKISYAVFCLKTKNRSWRTSGPRPRAKT